jgi:hypothetical protein
LLQFLKASVFYVHVLAVGTNISAPFRSGNFVRTSLQTPALHYIFIYASTSAPHSFGNFLPFHSASSIHAVSHYPSHLPRISNGYFHSLRQVYPNKIKNQ